MVVWCTGRSSVGPLSAAARVCVLVQRSTGGGRSRCLQGLRMFVGEGALPPSKVDRLGVWAPLVGGRRTGKLHTIAVFDMDRSCTGPHAVILSDVFGRGALPRECRLRRVGGRHGPRWKTSRSGR
ncbi:unnamed protein product [Scytosiphon promiscuus]